MERRVRGNAFEAQVKADGAAQLLTLLREHLRLPIPQAHYDDLSEVGGNVSMDLSGRRDATDFHLEAGRLCVLASRRRHACVVVARAGIPELLDAHPSTEPVHLNVPVKFPDGWEANQALMSHLSQLKVRAA